MYVTFLKEVNNFLQLTQLQRDRLFKAISQKITSVRFIIVYRNTWLRNQKLLIIDLIVNIILDYLKKTVDNLFPTNVQGGVLKLSPLELLNKILEKYLRVIF